MGKNPQNSGTYILRVEKQPPSIHFNRNFFLLPPHETQRTLARFNSTDTFLTNPLRTIYGVQLFIPKNSLRVDEGSIKKRERKKQAGVSFSPHMPVKIFVSASVAGGNDLKRSHDNAAPFFFYSLSTTRNYVESEKSLKRKTPLP